jgi:VanZ family protein
MLMALLGRFAPPLALMALIFALSAQADLNSGLGLVDHIGRKGVHMAEYGLLFVLWYRALRWTAPGAAALITIAYASTDEFHQTFVHGRVGTPVDVLIDSAGVLIAYLVVRAVRRRRGRGAAGDPRSEAAGSTA